MVSSITQQNPDKILKYPRSVAFIISNEFCERFNYYGMRTILVLYLTRKLGYDDDTSTVLYHIFTSLAYFFPLIGALIADSYFGRFKTIFYLSVVYAIGTIIIAVGAIPVLQLPAKTVTVIGLLLIAMGTGGIKPCVSAFGGDQFQIPEQTKQLASFFSLFYFAINAGSLVSTSLTPILREDVHCFHENDCFSLAFGVPAILMVFSIFIFMFGKHLYVLKKPAGNMITAVSSCITEAIRQRSNHKYINNSLNKKEHWLDYAEEKCGQELVRDTKSLLKILVLYLPLPLFWALFDQQGSRWTFQATRMIGDISNLFTIKPDQIQVINPFLILIFIPFFDYAVYPLLYKIGIRRPLQKMTLGGLLAALAFILSGILEIQLEQTDPIIMKTEESYLRIFNNMPCEYKIHTNITNFTNINNPDIWYIENMTLFEKHYINMKHSQNITFYGIPNIDIYNSNCPNVTKQILIEPGNSYSIYMQNHENIDQRFIQYKEINGKPKNGLPVIRFLTNYQSINGPLLLQGDNNFELLINDTNSYEIPTGQYSISINNVFLMNIHVKHGGVYVYQIYLNDMGEYVKKTYILALPNSVHMLWQLPQYIIITAGEVMFSVTGLEFSFTQAPASMKSVLQACWLLTVAVGNLFVVFIAEFIKFESQAFEFFCFAALMVLDMGIFIILALRYTYVTIAPDNNNENGTDLNNLPSPPISSSSLQKAQNKNDHKIESQSTGSTTQNGGQSNAAFVPDS